MEITKDKKVALVFDANHKVGRKIVPLLLQHDGYSKVLVFSETPFATDNEKLIQFSFDPSKLSALAPEIKGHDLFCFYDIQQQANPNTLDTIKIRNLYTYQISSIASENKVSQLFFLSSVHTDKFAMNLPKRIRGHLEESLLGLPFWAIHLFRPPFISDNDWSSWIGNWGKNMDTVTGGLVSKYFPTQADMVAALMVHAAQQLKGGAFLYHSTYFNDFVEKRMRLEV